MGTAVFSVVADTATTVGVRFEIEPVDEPEEAQAHNVVVKTIASVAMDSIVFVFIIFTIFYPFLF